MQPSRFRGAGGLRPRCLGRGPGRRLRQVLEAHARRCYGLLKDDGLRAAQALAVKLERRALEDGFTLRDVRRNQWRSLTTDDAIHDFEDAMREALWANCEEAQPYRCFHRLDLTEERADTAEFILPPELKEPGCLRHNLPLIGFGQTTPCVNMATDLIDDRSSGRIAAPLSKAPCLRQTPIPFAQQLSVGVTNFALRRLSTIFCVGWCARCNGAPRAAPARNTTGNPGKARPVHGKKSLVRRNAPLRDGPVARVHGSHFKWRFASSRIPHRDPPSDPRCLRGRRKSARRDPADAMPSRCDNSGNRRE